MAPKKADISGVHTNQAMSNMRDKDHPERPHLLSVAENVLCWEHLKPYINEFMKLHEYDNMFNFHVLCNVGILPLMMVVLI